MMCRLRAAELTNLATTEHRVHARACWAEGGSLWKARQPKCAAKQEGESPRMSWCVTWTSQNHSLQTDGGLRWSWMASHCSVDASSAVDATIVSALHCDGSPHQGAVNIDAESGEERSGPTRNWLGREGELVWLSWA